MLPTIALSQNQENWLTIGSFVLALLAIIPLLMRLREWLHRLLNQLGRPGRHLDRMWRHRSARLAKQIIQNPNLYYTGLWKRLFFGLAIVGAGVMFSSDPIIQANDAVRNSFLFVFGTLIYFTGLSGGSWAKTYATPLTTLAKIRKKLNAVQQQRNANKSKQKRSPPS